MRYVVNAAEPFIVPVTHPNDSRVNSIGEPLRTITGANRGEKALVTPVVTRIGQTGFGDGGKNHRVDKPLTTITSKAEHLLVSPTLIQTGYGERPGQDPRCRTAEAPLSTVVPPGNGAQLVAAFMAQHNYLDPGRATDAPLSTITGINKQALIAAYMAQHNRGATGHSVEDPLSTLTGRGSQQQLVASHLLKLRNNCHGSDLEAPLHTLAAQGEHFGLVASFMAKYYRTATGCDLHDPLHTITGTDRFADIRATLTRAERLAQEVTLLTAQRDQALRRAEDARGLKAERERRAENDSKSGIDAAGPVAGVLLPF